MRIRAEMEKYEISRQVAEEQIKNMDKHRIRWSKYLYDVDWRDPINFDIVINLANIKMQSAKDIICELVQEDEYKMTEDANLKMRNLCLASEIQARLALNLETQTLNIQVDVSKGTAHLKGVIESEKFAVGHS